MRKKEFANQILKTLENLPNDDRNKLNRLDYLESRLTVDGLTKLAKKFAENDDLISSVEELNPFFNFLAKRRELFITDGNNGDSLSLKTKADRICLHLANRLCKEANTISYCARNPNELVSPILLKDNAIDPRLHLRNQLMSNVTSKDKLIVMLLILNKKDWAPHLDDIEPSKLIKLISDGGSTLDEVLNSKNEHPEHEDYQRAYSFCKTYLYLKERMKGSKFNSYTGGLLNFFNIVNVPNQNAKTKAAINLLTFLASDNNLEDFNHHLSEPSGSLYPDKMALEDKRLQKITKELKDFANLQALSENVKSTVKHVA